MINRRTDVCQTTGIPVTGYDPPKGKEDLPYIPEADMKPMGILAHTQ
jgi:hypothetical protein